MFILTEMYMFANVHVCGEVEHFCVRVSSRICMCEWLSLCMCVSKGCTDAVKYCPNALPFGLAFPGPLRPERLRLSCAGSTEPVACAAGQTGIFDTGTHNAVNALLHFFFAQ